MVDDRRHDRGARLLGLRQVGVEVVDEHPGHVVARGHLASGLQAPQDDRTRPVTDPQLHPRVVGLGLLLGISPGASKPNASTSQRAAAAGFS